MSLLPIIRRMQGKRVLVVGDIMLDKYIWGNVSRISPEAPVQIVDVQRESFTVGGAGNTAANIVSLGGEAYVVGVVGEDDSWKRLHDEMRKRGMSTDGIIVDTSRKTTRKTRVMGGTQQLLRIDRESNIKIAASVENGIIGKISNVMGDVDIVIVSDYAKGVVTQKIIDFLESVSAKNGIKIIVDPKPSNNLSYDGVFLITPNQREGCEIAGWRECADDRVEELGREIMAKTGCAVLITRGEKGMALFDKDSVTHIETKAKEVYDVSGAGDTVAATLGIALAAGASLKEAAAIANYAAGVVVGKLGTSSLTIGELEDSLDE